KPLMMRVITVAHTTIPPSGRGRAARLDQSCGAKTVSAIVAPRATTGFALPVVVSWRRRENGGRCFSHFKPTKRRLDLGYPAKDQRRTGGRVSPVKEHALTK